MGRKPTDDPRVSLSRLVHGGTLPLLTMLAKGWGVSEGVAIDRAVQLAAIAESFGPMSIKAKDPLDKVAVKAAKAAPEVIERYEKAGVDLLTEPKPKYVAPEGRFHKRKP